MAQVPSQYAKAGMVLAREVVDGRGRLLIPLGRELTERHVSALRAWGIAYIDVAGDDPVVDAAAQQAPEVLAAAEAEMVGRFALVDGATPFVALLHREAVARRARRLARGGSGEVR